MKTQEGDSAKKSATDFIVIVPEMPVTATAEKMNTSGAGALNMSSSFYRRTDLTRDRVKEYLWAAKLTAEEPTATWSFDEEDDDQDFLLHTLFLRHVTLGAEAKDSERNLVMCEAKDWEDAELKFPICSLTMGKSETCHLDLNFHPDMNVTFRLTQGMGPVHIVGQHMVEFPEEDDDILEYNTEDAVTEESGEEETDTRKVKVLKRKAKGALKNKEKRGKLDASVDGSEEDEDEDEEDDEEDDEDEENDEEEMEEDEEDDDDEEEEEEEEEESPKKKPVKKAAKTTKTATTKKKPTAAAKGKKEKATTAKKGKK